MDYVVPYGNAGPGGEYLDRQTSPAIVQGSIPPAAAIEHPMREIVEVIRHWLGDQAPDAGDLTQLRQAIATAVAAVPGSPAGAVMPFAGPSAPAGWLKANGAAVPVAGYAALDAAIYCGDVANDTADWGFRCTDPLNPPATRAVDGTHVVLPDLRGEFTRGWDDGRGADGGRSLWAWQPGTAIGEANSGYFRDVKNGDGTDGSFSTNFVTGDGSASYTYRLLRPRNLALLWCIKV